jgi:hypothetical protein
VVDPGTEPCTAEVFHRACLVSCMGTEVCIVVAVAVVVAGVSFQSFAFVQVFLRLTDTFSYHCQTR